LYDFVANLFRKLKYQISSEFSEFYRRYYRKHFGFFFSGCGVFRYDVGNRNLSVSAVKNLGNVGEFDGAWRVVMPVFGCSPGITLHDQCLVLPAHMYCSYC